MTDKNIEIAAGYDPADNDKIRALFPLIDDSTAYLDNAATTQKPECVIRALAGYYEHDNANPLRGLYKLSVRATEGVEGARQTVADFIGAREAAEIIFTRNATESLNLAAYSYGMNFLKEGDEIVITIMEHHSNMLPWQQVAKHTGAVLKYVDTDENGRITPEMVEAVVTDKTKIVSTTQLSNVLGWENDVKAFAQIAHRHGAIMIVDGAQSVPHIRVDVSDIDCDFLAFSGHKIYGPMGVGVLYGKRELLEAMPPFLFGGEMIDSVTRFGATYSEIPHKFEAGTLNAEGIIGLGAALDFVNQIGIDKIRAREDALTAYAWEKIKPIPHIRILGADDPSLHHGIITFTIDGVHPHDVSYILDTKDICVRAGHHCAQPLMKQCGVFSTTRASLAFYNTKEEIDRLADELGQMRAQMGYDR